MRSGKRPASIAYYLAFVSLIGALAVAAGLFARAVRQTSVRAEITVADAEPVDCPTGERAPACYQFEIRNLGPEAAEVSCSVEPADRPFAEFLGDPGGYSYVYAPALQPGLSFSLVAKVQPGADGVVRPPGVACVPS
jgi:hypothetical protein